MSETAPPLRVAIVGSGPSGFYAAGGSCQTGRRRRRQVDLFDRLPTPWGLVRAGVAPDHPKIKSVTPRLREDGARTRASASSATSSSAATSPTRSSARRYHAVHLRRRRGRPTAGWGSPARICPGAGRGDRVRRLVQRPPRLRATSSSTSRRERAVVVGNGNVALDVARMLALTPDELRGDRHRRPRARGAAATRE